MQGPPVGKQGRREGEVKKGDTSIQKNPSG